MNHRAAVIAPGQLAIVIGCHEPINEAVGISDGLKGCHWLFVSTEVNLQPGRPKTGKPTTCFNILNKEALLRIAQVF